MRRFRLRVGAASAALLCCMLTVDEARGETPASLVPAAITASASVDTVTADFAIERAEERIVGAFDDAGISYPPAAVTLVALKQEARLELWAEAGRSWTFVRSYLIRSTSGHPGPKLREGDHQVPEGLYRIIGLNPKSSYYLSLRLDYPNDFDRAHGLAEGRRRLGGDIVIHGGRVSRGCLPVGDDAIEELFALAARVGPENTAVIVAPEDLRRIRIETAVARVPSPPPWLAELYTSLAMALASFPLPQDDEPVVVAKRLTAGIAKCKAYDADDCARRCARGDVASCARAGVMYRDGRGVASDEAEAWSFLRKACAGRDALGCAELGQLHLADNGLRRDAGRAADLARAACASGEGHGCVYLANLCIDRVVYPDAVDACGSEAVDALRAKAVAMLQADCRGWAAYDCSALAGIYADGDPDTAYRFASGACRGGDSGGCYALARLADRSASWR